MFWPVFLKYCIINYFLINLSLFVDELINEVELGACYSFTLTPHREFHSGQYLNQLHLVFEVLTE